ncbi:energy transducer TonB [Dokdonella sp.]|uniref:energy transducer TonB n=1 Tax=Dokdonella sp. TaxID=2291710 RepID=UPI003C5F1ED7
MAIGVLDSTRQGRWSWLRIGGLSGTVFVHSLALILLAIPVALPGVRPLAPATSIIWIQAPPEPVLLPVPDEPVPLPKPQAPAIPVVAPISTPDVQVESEFSEPVMSVTTPSIPSIVAAVTSNPASVADASLEYESIVRPKYPIAAVRRGEQGTVLVRVSVGRDGLPTQVDVARSSGSRHLDKAACEAVQRWRFHPVRINGVAMRATGIVPVAFELEKR